MSNVVLLVPSTSKYSGLTSALERFSNLSTQPVGCCSLRVLQEFPDEILEFYLDQNVISDSVSLLNERGDDNKLSEALKALVRFLHVRIADVPTLIDQALNPEAESNEELVWAHGVNFVYDTFLACLRRDPEGLAAVAIKLFVYDKMTVASDCRSIFERLLYPLDILDTHEPEHIDIFVENILSALYWLLYEWLPYRQLDDLMCVRATLNRMFALLATEHIVWSLVLKKALCKCLGQLAGNSAEAFGLIWERTRELLEFFKDGHVDAELGLMLMDFFYHVRDAFGFTLSSQNCNVFLDFYLSLQKTESCTEIENQRLHALLTQILSCAAAQDPILCIRAMRAGLSQVISQDLFDEINLRICSGLEKRNKATTCVREAFYNATMREMSMSMSYTTKPDSFRESYKDGPTGRNRGRIFNLLLDDMNNILDDFNGTREYCIGYVWDELWRLSAWLSFLKAGLFVHKGVALPKHLGQLVMRSLKRTGGDPGVDVNAKILESMARVALKQ